MTSRMNPVRALALASVASGIAAALAFNGCEGSATQTTTGQGLHGTLVDIHGMPVPGAQIKAWPAASSPNGLPGRPDSLAAVLAETDGEGRYSLPVSEAGIYNLYGESRQGDASVLVPRVRYLETALEVGTDTLAPSGAIAGKVVAEGKPLTPVFCYLQGSTFVALTDSAGDFVLQRIPAGTYRLNYVAQGYSPEIDSPVVVLPGQTVSLPMRELERDLDGQPPAAQILVAEYDTVEGFARIVWNHAAVADRKGYYVESFRLGKDSLALRSRIFQQDSLYKESIGRWFGAGFGADADPREVEEFTQVFRIRTVDNDGNVSPLPSEPIHIKVTRPEVLKYSVSLRLAEGDRDTVLCQDSLAFILDLDQPSKGPIQAHWMMTAWLDHITKNYTSSPRVAGIANPTDHLVWRWDPNWAGDGSGPAMPDSLLLEVLTQPLGAGSRGDERHIKIRVTPEGCYAVEKSRAPAVLPDKYGNYPDY